MEMNVIAATHNFSYRNVVITCHLLVTVVLLEF